MTASMIRTERQTQTKRGFRHEILDDADDADAPEEEKKRAAEKEGRDHAVPVTDLRQVAKKPRTTPPRPPIPPPPPPPSPMPLSSSSPLLLLFVVGVVGWLFVVGGVG